MLTVGLTGGLATGKSTVAQIFKSLGAVVIDADKIVHEQLKKEGRCFKPVVRHFGSDILRQGVIDRKRLGEIVFRDSKELKVLEKIIHPVVWKVIKEKLQSYKRSKRHQIVVVEIPLLFEAGFTKMFDRIIVVTASRDVQLKRAVKNLRITEKEAKVRIKRQMPLKDKIRLADIIIDNSQTKTKTKKEVIRIWQELQ